MGDLASGLGEAFSRLAAGDAEVYGIAARTLIISLAATGLSLLIGCPVGLALARGRFPGRTLLLSMVHTGMGMPPVVVGLFIWLLMTRSGPLGGLGIIYSPTAMVIAQFLIATPLVIGFTAASIQSLPPLLPDLLASLGAGPLQSLRLLLREARLGILAAVMAGFGAVVSEVGAAMTVGGNLRGSTRVLTTAIVTATGRGELSQAAAFGIILLALAFAVTLVLTLLQQRRAG
ncbi:MAG TPA: ABC transporter permease [Gemmatimonadales bacterium]|nr:ABC transporter permease [Gemmatimonadales bacterium]